VQFTQARPLLDQHDDGRRHRSRHPWDTEPGHPDAHDVLLRSTRNLTNVLPVAPDANVRLRFSRRTDERKVARGQRWTHAHNVHLYNFWRRFISASIRAASPPPTLRYPDRLHTVTYSDTTPDCYLQLRAQRSVVQQWQNHDLLRWLGFHHIYLQQVGASPRTPRLSADQLQSPVRLQSGRRTYVPDLPVRTSGEPDIRHDRAVADHRRRHQQLPHPQLVHRLQFGGPAQALCLWNGVVADFGYNDHFETTSIRYSKAGSADLLNLAYNYGARTTARLLRLPTTWTRHAR